jgi:hypothetical protein
MATPAELAVAYGQGARDTIMMLAILPASDRDQLLASARRDRDNERFTLCDKEKHWLVRTDPPISCPYCPFDNTPPDMIPLDIDTTPAERGPDWEWPDEQENA